jgi:hypothetical protein
MSAECDFGALRKIMLPPNTLTIPRTELPMEQLLNIRTREGTCKRLFIKLWPKMCVQILASTFRITPDDVSASSADDPKEKDDSEILRIFDGNNSLRNQIYRTASVPKTATVQQIRVRLTIDSY